MKQLLVPRKPEGCPFALTPSLHVVHTELCAMEVLPAAAWKLRVHPAGAAEVPVPLWEKVPDPAETGPFVPLVLPG